MSLRVRKSIIVQELMLRAVLQKEILELMKKHMDLNLIGSEQADKMRIIENEVSRIRLH